MDDFPAVPTEVPRAVPLDPKLCHSWVAFYIFMGT